MPSEVLESLKIACPRCTTANRVPAARLDEDPRCGQCSAPLLTGGPVALDEARFSGFVARTELPVLVDFWAGWCGPCRAMAGAFEQVAAELRTRAVFAKLDVDAAPSTSGRFGVRSIPTLILFKRGAEAARVSGALDAARLRAWVTAQL